MISAVLAVNVVVAAERGATRQVLTTWDAQRFRLFISEGIAAEIGKKLRNPHIGGRYGVIAQDVDRVRAMLLAQATLSAVTPQDIAPMTGDLEDDYVLATVLAAHSDYLVTGDKGLLALQRYYESRLVTPPEFMAILMGSTAGESFRTEG